jgi:hypothetical protein
MFEIWARAQQRRVVLVVVGDGQVNVAAGPLRPEDGHH